MSIYSFLPSKGIINSDDGDTDDTISCTWLYSTKRARIPRKLLKILGVENDAIWVSCGLSLDMNDRQECSRALRFDLDPCVLVGYPTEITKVFYGNGKPVRIPGLHTPHDLILRCTPIELFAETLKTSTTAYQHLVRVRKTFLTGIMLQEISRCDIISGENGRPPQFLVQFGKKCLSWSIKFETQHY